MASVAFEQNTGSIPAWWGHALPKTQANPATPETPSVLPQTTTHLANDFLETSSPENTPLAPTVLDKIDLHAKLFKNLAAEAGYKYRGQGIVHQGWGHRTLQILKGGANERYQTATLRAQQKAIIPVIQHLHAAQQEKAFENTAQRWQAVNAGLQNSAVTRAFLSLDNTPSLQMQKPELLKTLGRRERVVLKLNRWAFGINGLNEIVLSLTGVCCNSFKKCFFPNGKETSGGTGLKILATLAAITLATAALSRAFFGKFTNPYVASIIREFTAFAVRLICSINAIGFVLAFFSNCFGMAANVIGKQSQAALPEALQKQVEANWQENIKRLGAVLFEATSQAEMHFFLCKALQAKIGKQTGSTQQKILTANNTSLDYTVPILVEKLIQVFKIHQKLGIANQENLFWAINNTLGHYMAEPSHAKEKAERAIHVRKLLSLVQNARIDVSDEQAIDIRQNTEVRIGQIRTHVLNILGHGFAACRLKKISDWCKQQASQDENATPDNDTPRAYSLRHILQNKHQHSRLTVGLANISQGLRHFNNHVVLCRNGLLARAVAKCLRALAYKCFQKDIGILQTFTLGRMVSCAVWAVIEALMMSFAAGQGHGIEPSLNSTTGSGPFPMKLEMGDTVFLLTVINTALQMLVVHSFVLMFQGLASACAWADTHVWRIQQLDEKTLAQREQRKLVFSHPELTSTAINPF